MILFFKMYTILFVHPFKLYIYIIGTLYHFAKKKIKIKLINPQVF